MLLVLSPLPQNALSAPNIPKEHQFLKTLNILNNMADFSTPLHLPFKTHITMVIRCNFEISLIQNFLCKNSFLHIKFCQITDILYIIVLILSCLVSSKPFICILAVVLLSELAYGFVEGVVTSYVCICVCVFASISILGSASRTVPSIAKKWPR